jgi:hypothetical protein
MTALLRQRMMEDMQLRGLSARTQGCYVAAVRQLAEHYHRRPDQITEEELRQLPSTGVAWAGGAGSSSGHLPGSTSFAACASATTRGPTPTRHSSRTLRADLLAVPTKELEDRLTAWSLSHSVGPGRHH